MYAIIEASGQQFKVKQGDVLTLDRVDAEEGKNIRFNRVLAVGDEKNIKLGTPYVDGASVGGSIIEHDRGPKIRIFKFRRRHNYRLRKGHRQDQTQVRIEEIKG